MRVDEVAGRQGGAPPHAAGGGGSPHQGLTLVHFLLDVRTI